MKLLFLLNKIFPKYFKSIIVLPQNPIIIYINISEIILILKLLKRITIFKFVELLDIWTVDYFNNLYRFELNYLFLNLKYNERLILRLKLNIEQIKEIPTLTKLFKTANWLEREVWDMFGISFKKHPRMTKILTDYGFKGNPLRKNFPLLGYYEIRYDDQKGRIIKEKIQGLTEYRNYTFNYSYIYNQ